jgi:hypothetical protein
MHERPSTEGGGGPYTVRSAKSIVIVWFGIFVATGAAIGLYRAHEYGPIWICVVFIAVFLTCLLMSGEMIFDQEAVTHRCRFGTFRMRWSDVREIEHGTGNLVLVGDNSRFVIASPTLWSGPEKSQAWKLLVRKIEASRIIPVPSNTADYKWHWNVRVPH